MFKELIWVKNDSLSESFCNHLIERFEVDPLRDEGKVDQNNPRVDRSLKVTMDTGITSNPAYAEEDKILYEACKIALDEYEQHLEVLAEGNKRLHPSYDYEIKDTGYKIQKYAPDGYYHWHHDWCLQNGWSRTFTYLWYLNTIEEKDGGWTEFIDGTKVQPKCGSILFFPATWTYVHRGYTTKVPKYLVNGWIYGRPRS